MDKETQRGLERVHDDIRPMLAEAARKGLRLKPGGEHVRLFWNSVQVGVVSQGEQPPRGIANLKANLIRCGALKRDWTDRKAAKARASKQARLAAFRPIREQVIAELSRRNAIGGLTRSKRAGERTKIATELVGEADAANFRAVLNRVLKEPEYLPTDRYMRVLVEHFDKRPKIEVEPELVEAAEEPVEAAADVVPDASAAGVLALQALVRSRDQQIARLQDHLRERQAAEGEWRVAVTPEGERLVKGDESYKIDALVESGNGSLPAWQLDLLALVAHAGPQGLDHAEAIAKALRRPA